MPILSHEEYVNKKKEQWAEDNMSKWALYAKRGLIKHIDAYVLEKMDPKEAEELNQKYLMGDIEHFPWTLTIQKPKEWPRLKELLYAEI